MYLSKISIKDFRMFSDAVEVSFSKGLNLLVGENGSGKSSVVDAIRALLGENEFLRTNKFISSCQSRIWKESGTGWSRLVS